MDDITRPICFFNNCYNRDHIAIFGTGAFFDLSQHSNKARDLIPSQICVVASYFDDCHLAFNWYSFAYEALIPDEHDELTRVFFGRLLASERMGKSKAARSIRYSALFKRTGYLKNGSVFWKDVPLSDRPSSVQEQLRNGAKSVGAGFGDYLENKLVEVAAVRLIKTNYEEDGWTVRTVERESCGFDLECSKDGAVENVEVKGVRGSLPCFIITAGELNQARKNRRFFLTVVTSALSSSPKIAKYSGADFCQQFHLSVIQYRAALKS
jgi:hypothetical protein